MTEVAEAHGLRERKKRATRAALNEAAVRLCAEHDVQHVTVEQIAEAANVSPRTFFNYFASKEEAVVAGYPLGERFCAVLAARPVDEPLAVALRTSVHELLDGMEPELRARIGRYHAVMLHNPSLLPHHLATHQSSERALAGVLAARMGIDPAADLRPALVAAGTVTALRVATKRWLERDGNDLRALALQAIDHVTHGFAAELVPG